ncbi:hypothetical protein GCM10027093_54770 [Paraburkholderia jirisanensis]
MAQDPLNITITKGFRKLPDGNTLGFWPESDGVVMQEWAGQDGKGDLLSQQTLDYDQYGQYRLQKPDLHLPDLSPPKSGNTVGKVVGKSSITLPTITVTANAPVKPETAAEGGFWGAVGGWVHGGLDAAGLIPGLGAVPDLLNAGIYAVEGDYVNAGISAVAAIPVVGDAALAGKYAVKGGELVAKEGERLAAKESAKVAEQVAKEAEEKAAKEATEKAEKEAAENAEKDAAKEGEDGAKSEGKDELKCGDSGKYGDLLKQSGGNKFDRDHVPSKAALNKIGRQILADEGLDLTKEELLRLFGDKNTLGLIANEGKAIAIDKADHQQESRTYGRRNNPEQIAEDAKDAQAAARKDTKKLLDDASRWGERCKEKYEKWAAEIVERTHADYVRDIGKLIEKVISERK